MDAPASSAEPRATEQSSPLQFDKAEFDQAATVTRSCGQCQQALGDEYFEAAGAVVCPGCAQTLSGKGGSRKNALRAAAYGAAAALVGTLVWFAIMKVTKLELGIVAIAVGLLVGLAVRKGSRGVRGWKYQALAMALTYVSITASYAPMVFQGIIEASKKKVDTVVSTDFQPAPQPASVPATEPATGPATATAASAAAPSSWLVSLLLLAAVVFGIAFAAPFLGGVSNIMGIIIIGVALYEAWKLNRRVPVTGPFRFAAPPASEPAADAAAAMPPTP
jgi:hypothetical protein